MPNGSSLAVASGRGVGLPPGLWPAALLSIQTAVCLFKSPITMCVYFEAIISGPEISFLHLLAPTLYLLPPHPHPLLHFSFLMKNIVHSWKRIKRRKMPLHISLKSNKTYRYGIDIVLESGWSSFISTSHE